MAYVNEGSIIITSVIFIILGILAVALRFKVRSDQKLALGQDDWLILSGLVCWSEKLCLWFRAVTNTEKSVTQIFMVASAITMIIGMFPGSSLTVRIWLLMGHAIGAHSSPLSSVHPFLNDSSQAILTRKVNSTYIFSNKQHSAYSFWSIRVLRKGLTSAS